MEKATGFGSTESLRERFLGESKAKNPLASAGDAGDMGSSSGLESSLENEMATHSNNLAWEILWAEKPGELQSIKLQRIRHK